MMKKSFIFSFFFLLSVLAMAQSSKVVFSPLGGYDVHVHAQFDMPAVQSVEVDGSRYSLLAIDNCKGSSVVGKPQLPVFSCLIELPLCDTFQLAVNRQQISTLSLPSPLYPSQLHVSKSDTVCHPFVCDSVCYLSDTAFAFPAATLTVLGVYRDRRIARLTLSPTVYNAVMSSVETCGEMTVDIHYMGVNEQETERIKSCYASPLFDSGKDLAYSYKATKGVSDKVSYVIVSDAKFRGKLDDFVALKRRQAYSVDVVYTDVIGVSQAGIAAYLKSLYTNATVQAPAPTFVLLVGDFNQITPFRSKVRDVSYSDHFTDLYFFTWTDDFIPDCYYGRLSANSLAELQPQLDKIMYYEQYHFFDPSYLSDAVLVTGLDDYVSPGDNAHTVADPSMDYVAGRYINAIHNFKNVKYYKNDTDIKPYGVPDTQIKSSMSNTAEDELSALYSQGQGWVHYSGHGIKRGFYNPEFFTTDVRSMTNVDKPGVYIGSCCYTCMFDEDCFGEALLRRSDRAGAVVYVGASDATYWDDDFYWSVGFRGSISKDMHSLAVEYDSRHQGAYDLLFHDQGQYFSTWAPTMAQFVHAGNNAVTGAETDLFALYYWEIYHVLGDPSLMPYLGEAKKMDFSISQPLRHSDRAILVNAAPYARIALLDAATGEALAVATADAEGVASLYCDLQSLDPSLNLTVYANAQNYVPESRVVVFDDDNDVPLVLSHLRINNAVAGDTVSISFRLKNVGADTLWYFNYVLRGDAQQLSPVVETDYISYLAPGETAYCNNVCQSVVSSSIPDQTTVSALLQIFSDTIVAAYRVAMVVDAPNIVVDCKHVAGTMTDGSDNVCEVTLKNTGHGVARQLCCILTQPFDAMYTSVPQLCVDSLNIGSFATFSFPYTLDHWSEYSFPLHVVVEYEGVEKTFPVNLTRFDEDFETSDFSFYPWQNSATYPWLIDDTRAFNGSYSIRSANNMPNNMFVASELLLPFSATESDSISFYYIVSSQKDCDTFSVFIDDMLMYTASGVDKTDWGRLSFAVDAGSHLLKLVYAKDRTLRAGEDAVWVDAIRLPDTLHLVSKMLYDTVCEGASYHFGDEMLDCSQNGSFVYMCDSLDTSFFLHLVVLPSPDVRILCADTAVLPSQITYLTAAGASSYRWSTGDTTDVVAISPVEPTKYYLEGYRYGCSGVDSIVVGVRQLDIDSVESMAILLYPNPTSGLLTIQAEGLSHASVFDANGRECLKCTPSLSDRLTVSLSSLPAGFYYVHVVADSKRGIYRVVKR